MIDVVCPGCGKRLSAPDDAVGKRATCPKCKAKVIVEAPAPPPPPVEFDPLDVLGGAKASPSFALSNRELVGEERHNVQQREVNHPVARPGDLVCASCGAFSSGKTKTPGSFLIELVLWLFMLLPGVIYSIWRITSRHRACDVCGGKELVPAATPRGRQLVDQFRS